MFWNTPILLLGALSAVCNALPVQDHSVPLNETSPHWHSFDKRAVQWVYRADKRSPEQIDKAGGFWAKGYTSKSKARPDLSLFNHVGGSSDSFMSKDSDGYVSTSTSRTVTEGWIDQYLGYSGYVYKIAAYHNLIDCQGTLLEYNKHPQEKEYAAIRGIEWEQVYSYSHFTAYQDKKGKYSKQGSDHLNKYFDRKRYTGRSTGGIRYDLAGFPRKHRAWTLKPWKAYYSTCAKKRDLSDDNDDDDNDNDDDFSADNSTVSALSVRDPAKTPKKAAKKPAKGGATGAKSCALPPTNQQVAQEYLDALSAGKTPKKLTPNTKTPADKSTGKKGKTTAKKPTKKTKKPAKKTKKPAKKTKKPSKKTKKPAKKTKKPAKKTKKPAKKTS